MTKELLMYSIKAFKLGLLSIEGINADVDAYSIALIAAKPNFIRSVANEVGINCPFCGEPCAECGHKATDV